MLIGKFAHGGMPLRCLYGGRWRKVIQDPGRFVGKGQRLSAHFLNHANGVGRASIVHHGKGHARHHQVTCANLKQAGVPRQ